MVEPALAEEAAPAEEAQAEAEPASVEDLMTPSPEDVGEPETQTNPS